MEVIRATTTHEAMRMAGETLSHELINKADRPALLLVSGGSSLAVLDTMSDVAVRANMQIGQIDERWTKYDRDLNAYTYKKTDFAKILSERGIPFVPIDTTFAQSAMESAQNYEDYLKRWRGLFSNGLVVGLFGIGTDGHIAGILPFPNQKEMFEQTFLNTRQWYAGYDTGAVGSFPTRITMTLHALMQEVDMSVVYVSGEEKREALRRTLLPDGSLHETPARILNETKNVHLFTDIQ